MMVTCTDLIVADHSRSAQGRVHFINARGRARCRHVASFCGPRHRGPITLAMEPICRRVSVPHP